MEMLTRARRRSDELGLTDTHVFFNEGWVPYDARAGWLLEADAGVSMHPEHIETRFSFRTRILDYLWAGIPVICTAGDSLADLIECEDAGLTVPAEDRGAQVQAIQALIDDPDGRARRARNARALGRTMTWEHAAEPLLRYCARPLPASNLEHLTAGDSVPATLRNGAGRRLGLDSHARKLGHLAGRALQILSEEG